MSRAPSKVLPGTEGGVVPARPEPAVGRSVARRDGPAKVTGAARYTDDLRVPDAWHGVTVRSTEPHARLLGIERDPAFDWSRVVVLTAADVPGDNVVGLLVDDQPVLAAGEIAHVAQPVALVAAPDRATAEAARDAITLRTEPLPPVLDPLASDRALSSFDIVRGDVESAFARADLIVERTYRVGLQEQAYLEPQAMIAFPRPDGVAVHGSLQCPYYVHAAVARALGLETAQVVVVQEETGGGFGGKEDYPSGLAIHAAMLALRVGRPVRMILDRHEDMAATTKRHPAIVTHRTGVTRDGDLVAQDIEVVMDAGAFTTVSPVVLARGGIHAAGPYRCADVRIRARAMATNTPPNGAFRGFGAPQTEFAAEMQVSRIADALGVSPAALRRRWAYREGDVTPTGQVLKTSVAAVPVLDRTVEASGFEAARAGTIASAERAGAGARAHGVGISLGWHGAGFTGRAENHLASVATVEMDRAGDVRVLAASTEIGQGSRTVFAQIAADALGIDVDEVAVGPIDTSMVPNSGPTVASRSTMMVGGLVARAARRLRDEVEARTGRPFGESRADDARAHGPASVDERFTGFPGIEWDPATYQGDAYPCFSWSGVAAEVDVDLDTGTVEVTSIVHVSDAGTIVNPLLAAGQVEGGTLQAIGYATIEEVKVDGGRYLNDRFATYAVPTALDAPRTRAIFVEEPFPMVPHGAKGLGELPMDAPAAAIVAAIHDATGAWVDELPATPEKVLAAMLAAEVSRP